MTRRRLQLAIVLFGAACLLAFGVFGLFLNKRPGGAPDFIWMYAAGRCWRQSLNPYDPVVIQRVIQTVQPYSNQGAFGYPPQSAALFVPLAFLGWPAAKAAWTLLQFGALALIVGYARGLLRDRSTDAGRAAWGAALLTAFILANSNTVYIVWDGQTSLIILAAALAAWQWSAREKPLAAGIALAVASMKPQQSAFLFVWFALERRWKMLGYAAAAITVFSAWPAAKIGVPAFLLDWYAGMRVYAKYNGATGTQNLESLLVSAGLPAYQLPLFGVAAAVALWWIRRRYVAADAIAFLLGLELLFLLSHIYDYVSMIPLFALLWAYSSRDRRRSLAAVLLFLLFHLPLRFIEPLHSPVLFNFRVMILILSLLFVFALSWGERASTVYPPSPQST